MSLTLDNIKKRLETKTKTIKIISNSYTSGKCNIECKCLNCNHEWTTIWQNLDRTPKCPECEQKCKMNQNKMIREFKKIHGERYIYSKSKYINCETKVIITCRKHGDFYQGVHHHLVGYGCNKCGNESVSIKNSMPKSGVTFADKYPDLIKYFKNKEEAYIVGFRSNKKVKTICPDCGNERLSVVENIPKGYICKVCSDKLSLPEKFGIYLFKQLNFNVDTQKIFIWSNKKRYDFYFVLNKKEYIIETHGSQHYNKISRGRTLKEEQENDLLKYNLAIENGIKPENYIVIDCRKSDFGWLKENYIKKLNHIFNLENVNWDNIWLNMQSKISIVLWEMWNNKEEDYSTTYFMNYFNLSRTSIINILKTGRNIGKCDYDNIEESYKRGARNKGKNCKKIYQYTKDMELICKWDSLSDIQKTLGFHMANIIKCAKGRSENSYGYVWRYELYKIDDANVENSEDVI